MGMDLYVNTQIISEDTYKLLQQGKLYIDSWLNIIDEDKINNYYKQLFFDIISAMTLDEAGYLSLRIDKDYCKDNNLFNYFKENYQKIIDDLNLDIYVDDDLTNYLTLDEWLKDDNYDYYRIRKIDEEVIDGKHIYCLVQAEYM